MQVTCCLSICCSRSTAACYPARGWNPVGGRFRSEQNWIGGSAFNPCSAEYVPPPHELVPDLVADLCEFCNDDSLPAVAQAAIAHAQFETIHPFVDGNGRVARALIHLVLRRRGVVSRALPPVSLILATWAQEYAEALTATRYLGPAASAAARQGLNRWVGLFAAAAKRAVADADAFEDRIQLLERTWRERLGRVRANSAADLLLRKLPGAPILTVQSATELIGRSSQATNEAITRLTEAKVLSQTTVGRRNRGFEAPEVIRAFTDLERQLASPSGDTRTAPPTRRVPRRNGGDGARFNDDHTYAGLNELLAQSVRPGSEAPLGGVVNRGVGGGRAPCDRTDVDDVALSGDKLRQKDVADEYVHRAERGADNVRRAHDGVAVLHVGDAGDRFTAGSCDLGRQRNAGAALTAATSPRRLSRRRRACCSP